MKGVETDAQRQGDANHRLQLQMGQTKPVKQQIIVLHREIEVLEKSQHREACTNGNGEPDLLLTQAGAGRRHLHIERGRPDHQPLTGYFKAADIVDRRGDEQKDDKQGIRPAVENVAQKRQGQMPAPAGQSIVDRKGQGQKIEEENLRAEYHYWPIRRSFAQLVEERQFEFIAVHNQPLSFELGMVIVALQDHPVGFALFPYRVLENLALLDHPVGGHDLLLAIGAGDDPDDVIAVHQKRAPIGGDVRGRRNGGESRQTGLDYQAFYGFSRGRLSRYGGDRFG